MKKEEGSCKQPKKQLARRDLGEKGFSPKIAAAEI